MKPTGWMTCLALLLAPAVAGAEGLHFAQHGFSIAAPQGDPTNEMQQVVMMMLPVVEGFASNVNVQVQAYPDTMDAYLKLSRDQFAQAGIKVLTEKKLSAESAILEYAGPLQGRELHWYARVMRSKQKGKIVLATATAPAGQWAKVGPKLKASVDSLKIE